MISRTPGDPALEEAVTRGRDAITEVVLEPVLQGAAGMRIYDVLAIYRDEWILERAAAKEQKIAAAFRSFGELPGVVRTRALGMTGALDLASSASYLGRAGWRVYEEARRRGAYLRPLGDVVYIAPPLNIPDDDLDELLGIVGESVRVAMASTSMVETP